MKTHPHFVPSGDSRRETAILLVGTADEYGIDQRSIRTDSRGFFITDELARVLASEMPEEFDLLGVESDGDGVSGNPIEDEPEPDDEDENEDEGFDPADHAPKQVKAFVTENPEYAQDVLDLERAGKNRPSLIPWLTEQVG